MKKSLALLVAPAALLIAVATAGPASAGSAGDGSGYGTQPGYAVATSHTACAGHGAFGAFGKDDNLAGGADGRQTGINNSSLCGNPQR
jgi:hypothetical protein